MSPAHSISSHSTNASRRLSRFWGVSHLLLEQRYGTMTV